jgi:hypothetical protein
VQQASADLAKMFDGLMFLGRYPVEVQHDLTDAKGLISAAVGRPPNDRVPPASGYKLGLVQPFHDMVMEIGILHE